MNDKFEELRLGDKITFQDFINTVKVHFENTYPYLDRYIYEDEYGEFRFADHLWTGLFFDFDHAMRRYRKAGGDLKDPRLNSLIKAIDETITLLADLRGRSYHSREKAKKAHKAFVKQLEDLETYDLSIIRIIFQNPQWID
jgi:hypothetical protein